MLKFLLFSHHPSLTKVTPSFPPVHLPSLPPSLFLPLARPFSSLPSLSLSHFPTLVFPPPHSYSPIFFTLAHPPFLLLTRSPILPLSHSLPPSFPSSLSLSHFLTLPFPPSHFHIFAHPPSLFPTHSPSVSLSPSLLPTHSLIPLLRDSHPPPSLATYTMQPSANSATPVPTDNGRASLQQRYEDLAVTAKRRS